MFGKRDSFDLNLIKMQLYTRILRAYQLTDINKINMYKKLTCINWLYIKDRIANMSGEYGKNIKFYTIYIAYMYVYRLFF